MNDTNVQMTLGRTEFPTPERAGWNLAKGFVYLCILPSCLHLIIDLHFVLVLNWFWFSWHFHASTLNSLNVEKGDWDKPTGVLLLTTLPWHLLILYLKSKLNSSRSECSFSKMYSLIDLPSTGSLITTGSVTSWSRELGTQSGSPM